MIHVSDIDPPGLGKPVGSNTPPSVKDSNFVASDAYIDSPADELVGHRIVSSIDGDVEVGGDFRAFPFGMLPR